MKSLLTALLSAALLFAVGCAGVGGEGSSDNSPFAGSWSGTWVVTGTSDDGTVTVVVSSGGDIIGTMHDNDSGLDGTLDGTIQSSGSVNATAQYPSQPALTLSGILSLNGDTITGNLVQSGSGTPETLAMTLTRD